MLSVLIRSRMSLGIDFKKWDLLGLLDRAARFEVCGDADVPEGVAANPLGLAFGLGTALPGRAHSRAGSRPSA